MRVEIKTSDKMKRFIVNFNDKESILKIISIEINRGFYFKFIDTICDEKVKYGNPDIIKGTDIYRDGFRSIGYSTYYVDGKGNICDNNITVYSVTIDILNYFNKVFNAAQKAGSINQLSDELILPDFPVELENVKENCKEREEVLKREIEKYNEIS